jgi:signal transduction protein with GAF and PtsI domain
MDYQEYSLHHAETFRRSITQGQFFVNSFLGVPIIINMGGIGVIVVKKLTGSQCITFSHFFVKLISLHSGNVLPKNHIKNRNGKNFE